MTGAGGVAAAATVVAVYCAPVWLLRRYAFPPAPAASAPVAAPMPTVEDVPDGWLVVETQPCTGRCRTHMPHEITCEVARCVGCNATHTTAEADRG
ncbi:hypothetical protein [Streptomyces qinglanensis]|uniref:Uncharacterized protein n=1 Tax=Streptomyces qinglanensis TaxID=943816 RepID=A0A1H9U5A0_9ACTN|nr:hypothetical protein [Streptomyces qinglanensis]SES04344.1 hypothetical protein SAMN05421870_107324 [Streptomyces qinglanensis]